MEAEAATARTVQASRLGVMSEDKPGGRVCRSHNLLLADRPIYQRTLRNPVCGHTFARCNIESRPDLADREATDRPAQVDSRRRAGAYQRACGTPREARNHLCVMTATAGP